MNYSRSIVAIAAVALMACGAAVRAADNGKAMDSMGGMDMSRYGGPVYNGDPALGVTASLVKAGGGAGAFSTATALTSMVGADTVNAEVAKLNKQYGAKNVKSWLSIFDYAVKDALGIATKAGVTLPEPTLEGKDLAATLVKAGLDTDNTFYTEFLLDKAVTHKIHVQVMEDIDKKFGAKADTNYHRISNQAFVDLAHALGASDVKLAEFH